MRIAVLFCLLIVTETSCTPARGVGQPAKVSPVKVAVNPDADVRLNVVVAGRCYFLRPVPGTSDLTLELRDISFPSDIGKTVEVRVSGGSDSVFRQNENLPPTPTVTLTLANAAGQSYFEVSLRAQKTSGGSVTGFVNRLCAD